MQSPRHRPVSVRAAGAALARVATAAANDLVAFVRGGEDAFAPHRERILLNLAGLSALLLLPFTVNHLLQQRWLLAAVIGVGQFVLLLDYRAVRAGKPPPVPFPAVMLMLVLAVLVSAWQQGLNGAFWAFPTLFVCYFVLARRTAFLMSLVLIVGVGALSTWTLGPTIAVRVAATLVLVWVMLNVVLNVISDQQRALLGLALTDPLTGAYNRRHLHERLAELERLPTGPNALLTIDIDHFKSINDRYGHAAGDEVLRRVVGAVQGRTRRTDVLFRTGGEEFVLLLRGTPMEEAMRVAEELRALIEGAELLAGERITVSIGVSMQREGLSADDWLKGSDHALYVAKRNGRNRIAFAA